MCLIACVRELVTVVGRASFGIGRWLIKNWNWTAIATCVIAIATVASLTVAFWQWTAINGQLTEMKFQSDVTRTQIKATMKLEYVKHANPNQGWYITPSWQNVGATDAKEFDGWVTSHLFIPVTVPDNFDFLQIPSSADKGFPTTIPTRDSNSLFSQHLSTSDMAKMEANAGLFIIWGYVEYKDVFDLPHHVTLLHGSAGRTPGARVAWRTILPSESGSSRWLVRITAGP